MRASHERGFTLIELVMVIIIVSILSVVMGKFLFQAYKAFVTSYTINEVDYQATIALQRLTNDIHNIRSASDITTINSNAFTFTNTGSTTIAYTVSGTTLVRNTRILIDNLSSITFGYLDINGSTTATASLVRYITISLTLTSGTLTQTYVTTVGTRGME